MGLIADAVGGLSESRAGTSGLASPAEWLTSLFGGEPSYSGKTVTVESSMSLIPVFSAVSLLAGGVGSLPLIVYRRLQPRGRERAYDHRTWQMLHEAPSDLMAADEFWELMTAHVLLWGNAFAAKGRTDPVTEMVDELIPLKPDRVQVGVKGGKRYYIVDGKGPYTDHDVLHVRGLGFDGVVGLSPIQQARQALGNELAREHFQGSFWKNNARPGGVLKHPNELTDGAAKRLKASWELYQGGLANAGRTAILEEGMEWQTTGMPLKDAEFIEQAKFSRSDIALLFRVPPHMLAAEVGSSLTYSTTEGQSIDFVTWALRRWLRRFEGALKADPDIFLQGSRFYPEFLIDALLRADSKTRAEFYAKALDPVKGWMVKDEARELENLNPLTEEQKAELEALSKKANGPLRVQHETGDSQEDDD